MILRSPRPDPEVRRLLLQLAMSPPPSLRRTGVDAARRRWQLAVKAFASEEAVEAVIDRVVPGEGGAVRLRAYVPGGGSGPRPVLAWFHGGGFVTGDLSTAAPTCRALANRTGAVVVAVEYRRAPEHPLEAGYADCLAAVRWLTVHTAELGGDPARLAVGGDSAGGGLAALVAQECARRGPALAAQVLVYPATDLTGSHPSATEAMPGLLTPRWMAWLRAHIASVSDLSDPRVSALAAPDLRGGPPAIVLTAGFDPLRDEGLAYAARLADAGVPVRALHYPGQIHGFVSFDRIFAGARHALTRLGAEFSNAFTGSLEPGVDGDLPPGRHVDQLLWLNPAQRWHELQVAALVACSWFKPSGARLDPRVCQGETP